MSAARAGELERLTAAEADAELRYVDAVKRSDSSEMQRAADEWKKAANAVTDFVLKYPSATIEERCLVE